LGGGGTDGATLLTKSDLYDYAIACPRSESVLILKDSLQIASINNIDPITVSLFSSAGVFEAPNGMIIVKTITSPSPQVHVHVFEPLLNHVCDVWNVSNVVTISDSMLAAVDSGELVMISTLNCSKLLLSFANVTTAFTIPTSNSIIIPLNSNGRFVVSNIGEQKLVFVDFDEASWSYTYKIYQLPLVALLGSVKAAFFRDSGFLLASSEDSYLAAFSPGSSVPNYEILNKNLIGEANRTDTMRKSHIDSIYMIGRDFLTVLGYSGKFVASVASNEIIIGDSTSWFTVPTLYDASSATKVALDYWPNGDFVVCYAQR